MVNNGDVQIEKPSDCLVAHIVSPVRLVFSHWARSTLSVAAQNDQCMTSKKNIYNITKLVASLIHNFHDHLYECKLVVGRYRR